MIPGASRTPQTLRHFFTVDVEEYYQVSAFERRIARATWDEYTSRVRVGTDVLMEFLARHDAKATFFVLGWVAQRQPTLLREIAAAGHEVASHGWDHRRVTTLSPQQFREDLRRSKELIEDLTGVPVLGYRAPSFSIVPGCEWALDILSEEGFAYDSSLFPVRRPGYGYPTGQKDPHWLDRSGGRLLEVPPSTLTVVSQNLPAAGGAYFRLFPYALVRSALRRSGRRGMPGTFYIHPWELDPEQPRVRVGWVASMRQYTGLRRVAGRLEKLLTEFRFTSIASQLPAEGTGTGR